MSNPIKAWASSSETTTAIYCAIFKVGYFLVILACIYLLPPMYFERNYLLNSDGIAKPGGFFAEHLATWDSLRYLYLSGHGYSAGNKADAFFPLWPACIRAFSSLVGGNLTVAAILLAAIFSSLGMVQLYRLIADTSWIRYPAYSIVLMLAYPGALFLFFPYSEALFLLLSTTALLALRKDNIATAAICLFLSPISRPTGIFWVPIIILYYTLIREYRRLWLAGVPLIGYSVYLLIMYIQTGNAFEGLVVLSQFKSDTSPVNYLDVVGFFMSLFHVDPAITVFGSPFDRIAFLWCAATLPFLYRKDKLLFAYTIGMGLLPAIGNHFTSFLRYALMAYPMFFVTAEYLSDDLRRPALAVLTVFCLGLQVIFLILFMNFFWIG